MHEVHIHFAGSLRVSGYLRMGGVLPSLMALKCSAPVYTIHRSPDADLRITRGLGVVDSVCFSTDGD